MEKTKIIALIVTIALVAIVITAGVTFAQTQTSTPTPTPQATVIPSPISSIDNHANCPATNDGTHNSNCAHKETTQQQLTLAPTAQTQRVTLPANKVTTHKMGAAKMATTMKLAITMA